MNLNYMQLAFDESLLAIGRSRPNPAVGAVVVKDGIVVGRGATQRPGNAHAEVMALRDAGELARGASIYVTLEPCCHYGRTPPCTKAIIEAGISEVYFAHADPNPQVRGKSRLVLEESGVKVFEGEEACVKAAVAESWGDTCGADGCKVLTADESISADFLAESRMLFHEIERFFEAYDYYVRFRKTFVEVKSALSQDGFMGAENPSGEHLPLKITAQGANCWNHELRAMSDAVLVGAGTLLADNPSLDVRLSRGNNPVKIVWAGHHVFSQSEIAGLRFFEDFAASSDSRLLFTCVPQPMLQGENVVLLSGKSFSENWNAMLADLSARGMHRLMVEPGACLAREIFTSGLWNRLDLWRSSDSRVDMALEDSGLSGLPYPELPEKVVARESFMIGSDTLTVYEPIMAD
ncbi:dihydrofolate reductase family protein [uncultured Fibrobacter sp.]|uniref:bifunctional diaminohydroxyphosphoribosylaminopyrimidine deaminase/5-amino-6-(5-phosphoribosylamino)uracil reductase n=1 Tax=uncultured Fibrobacter sp. TaxID=261512 RepID=UPI00261AC594|nr:dihydrofolate reductase family protein [uncultured Fibrobacter sp.]